MAARGALVGLLVAAAPVDAAFAEPMGPGDRSASDAAEYAGTVLDGEPTRLVVNGYSTSFEWPALLRAELDRLVGPRVIEVRPVVRGGSPIAKWMDVATGERRPVWINRLSPALRSEDQRVVVLAQQSLQWVYGNLRYGIRSADDTRRVERGADVIERYTRNLLEDGADAVLFATHIYKHRMEPAIGNERLALAATAKRGILGFFPGPDVWEPTKRVYPNGYQPDRAHPNSDGSRVMAAAWLETLRTTRIGTPPARPQ